MSQSTSNISAHAFKQLRQESAGKLRIIDLRTYAEVNTESLDGCAHFPVQKLKASELKIYLQQQNHEPTQPIYLLCASGQRAVRTANQLQDDLDFKLIIIEGGLNALKQLGTSVTEGDNTVISLERQVRIASGSLVVIGVLLGLLIHPWFYGLSAFVGSGLVFAGATNNCGMALVLAKMPWNTKTGTS
ncbi:MAG: rhodanese-like domain-containing protein [Pseudomonadales bacterium]|nr:rhodanese-like domain-containing protein [Pseudomonadales bacterium]